MAKRSNFEKMGMIAILFDQNKLLHNKVFELHKPLRFPVSDPDWKELTLERLTIQPTTMNVIIQGKDGWDIEFPREDDRAPYLKDEKGNVYKYDPSGPVLLLENGKKQLPFSSSIFFDTGAKNMQLHIGTVLVTESNPSSSFEISKKDTFPKSVQFKNRHIVIEGAEFKDEYILLKIKKEYPDQKILEGVMFYIPEYHTQLAQNKELVSRVDALREELKINGWERAESSNKSLDYLEVYIPAPKQEKYRISLQRVNDPIVINQDYPILIK